MSSKKLLYYYNVYNSDRMRSQNIKMKVEIYSNENSEEYNKFILNNPDSTIYHTIEWKNIIEKNFGYEPFYLLARNTEDKICAVLPLFLAKNIYGKRLDSIPQSPYGGLIGDLTHKKLLIDQAIELKKQLNCKLLSIRDAPFQSDIIFKEFDMKKCINWDRQIVKIEDPETMWNNLKKNNRENIRKAIKNNINIVKANTEEELKEFYYLISLTYKRLGFIVFPYEFFLDIWKTMRPKGYVEVLTVKSNGEAVASALNFLFNNHFFIAFGGWNKKEKKIEGQ